MKRLWIFCGSILIVGFVGGLVLSGRMSLTSPSGAAEPVEQVTPAPAPASRVSLPMASTLPDLSAVAEAALKVAANISSTTTSRAPDDPFAQFFGYAPRTQRSQSLGSGVVVMSNGYILTNNHVIGDARADVRVTLADGVERRGEVIGVDEVTDLAVVKVDAQNLQTLPWGDSSKLRIAEWVLAIGNPFQFTGTVTLGIISAVNRSGAQVGTYSNVIQTDAAINPGNSGGALVDAHGELIGINSMIYSESGGSQGIGFAIPSNEARRIMKQLIDTGSVPWGSIGNVRWSEINSAQARRLGLGDINGLLVWDLDPQSAAYRGGLRPDDIVLAFNGQPTPDYDHLDRSIIAAPVGSRVKVDVIRSGRRVSLDVPIVSRQQPRTRNR
jgi:serine protease Do